MLESIWLEANAVPAPEHEPDELAPNESPLDPIRAKSQLMEFFDIPAWVRSAPEVQTQLDTVIEWASNEAKYVSDNPTMADVLRVINDQLRVMGAQVQTDKLKRLWLFAKIRGQRRLLDERERGLYG